MNVIVLVKHALLADYGPAICADGRSFRGDDLRYEMNDWDRYALEEAVRLKEKAGAQVTAISVGANCDITLWKCIATGADNAIKVPLDTIDSWQIAKSLEEVVKRERFDIVIAGYQSQDRNNALVGPILAGMLNLPYATAVVCTAYEEGKVRLRRELEAGRQEELILPLPCLLTVQTGINEPRYVSISRVLKAKKKEIIEVDVGPKQESFEIERMYHPTGKRGQVIEGTVGEVSNCIIELLGERGLL